MRVTLPAATGAGHMIGPRLDAYIAHPMPMTDEQQQRAPRRRTPSDREARAANWYAALTGARMEFCDVGGEDHVTDYCAYRRDGVLDLFEVTSHVDALRRVQLAQRARGVDEHAAKAATLGMQREWTIHLRDDVADVRRAHIDAPALLRALEADRITSLEPDGWLTRGDTLERFAAEAAPPLAVRVRELGCDWLWSHELGRPGMITFLPPDSRLDATASSVVEALDVCARAKQRKRYPRHIGGDQRPTLGARILWVWLETWETEFVLEHPRIELPGSQLQPDLDTYDCAWAASERSERVWTYCWQSGWREYASPGRYER